MQKLTLQSKHLTDRSIVWVCGQWITMKVNVILYCELEVNWSHRSTKNHQLIQTHWDFRHDEVTYEKSSCRHRHLMWWLFKCDWTKHFWDPVNSAFNNMVHRLKVWSCASVTCSSVFPHLIPYNAEYMWAWSTKPVISRWGIFVEIAKNTLYGSKLLIFLLCQKSFGY